MKSRSSSPSSRSMALQPYDAVRRRRRTFIILAVVVVAGYFFFFRTSSNHTHVPEGKLSEAQTPPNWDELKEWERKLPQHNLDLPYPEGRTGRYVKFSNSIRFLGWNNVFNELLMNTHLAYESQRSFVFNDYYWKHDYYHWQESRKYVHDPRTPLNAIISGPSAGGPWDAGDNAPRSVSEDYFELVCPEHERKKIYTKDVKPAVADAPGQVVFDHWKNILLNEKERCVEVVPNPEVDGYPQTFDLWYWGHGTVLDMWERFIKSPTSRLLGPSPVVRAAVARNEYLFLPRGSRIPPQAVAEPFDRMLSVHVRRGDFKDACASLSTWKSSFYSWNLLPQLPDKFPVPVEGEEGVNPPERMAYYLKHCLPEFDDIVKKIHDSRQDYVNHVTATTGVRPTLDVIYLLTNAEGEFLDKLKAALKKGGWHTIVTSRDLVLDKQQRDVDMAIDMEIARRAAVFIGNGWSSFTSNVVHSRLKNDKAPISIRFF